jgi:predicted nucleic acid-binding protein
VSGVLVLDASAWVDILLETERGLRVRERIAGADLHAPAHVDIEMLSALGRLQRAGTLSEATVAEYLRLAERTPIHRHLLHPLTAGAWARRHNLRLTDAYYAELADQLDASLITTDRRLARAAPRAETP